MPSRASADEIVRGDFLDRIRIGLDFFEASISRIAAWVLGTQAMIRALLTALVEPTARLRKLEREGDFSFRLVLVEQNKILPFGAVWDYHCLQQGVPVGMSWMDQVEDYEETVTSKR